MLENLVQSFIGPDVSKDGSSFELFARKRNENTILTGHKSLTERSGNQNNPTQKDKQPLLE
uniref:Uncharacterized protein n=1 Tax=Glossina pallidipes TaxID=7398 RepID=A0A1B0A4E2_GLOPL